MQEAWRKHFTEAKHKDGVGGSAGKSIAHCTHLSLIAFSSWSVADSATDRALWEPFDSEMDCDVASWCIKEGVSEGAVNRLLNIRNVVAVLYFHIPAVLISISSFDIVLGCRITTCAPCCRRWTRCPTELLGWSSGLRSRIVQGRNTSYNTATSSSPSRLSLATQHTRTRLFIGRVMYSLTNRGRVEFTRRCGQETGGMQSRCVNTNTASGAWCTCI